MREDIVDCQEELEVVFVDPPTIFGPPIGQDAKHRQVVLIVRGQDPVIEQAGSGDPLPGRVMRSMIPSRGLGGVKLGMRPLAIGT